MKLQKRVTTIITFSILVLLGANLLVSNILSTAGTKLQEFEQRKANLQNQNSKLEIELIRQSSLKEIEIKARQLGLVKVDSVVYISEDLPIAMRNQ